jgi:glyoxylase-like metal-dependent hydrolase (beta-lactamase superfamily II)
VPILLHATEHFRIERAFPREAVTFVDDGEAVAYGGLRFRALHTPGHSAGAITWLLESDGGARYLFTGDTVFIRDCGRTDLPTGDTAQMFTSLRRLRALAEEGDAVLRPGHHYAPECASTLARELVTSPPFRCRTVEELAALP